MPRDISGNYTLPAGNPVVDGTIIDSVWANTTMTDVANQLNNVLTRDGVLPATNPIKFASGSAAAPSITFTAEPASGFYRDSAGVLGVAIGGASKALLSATLLALGVVLALPLGAVGAPSLSFTGDSNNGWWSPAADTQAWSVGGTELMRLQSVGLGVGMTPVYRLDVTGGAGNGIRYVGPTAQMLMGESGSVGAVGTITNHALTFLANSAIVGRFSAAGNFGIGVNPSYVFDVKTSTNGPTTPTARIGGTRSFFFQPETGSAFIYGPVLGFGAYVDTSAGNYIQPSGIGMTGGAVIAGPYDGGLQFYTYNAGAETGTTQTLASTLRMTLDASGNLGIGVAPSHDLDISKVGQTISAALRAGAGQASILHLCGNNTTAGVTSFDVQMDSAGNCDIVQRNNGRLSFYTNGTEYMRIAAGGNVSINAPTSGYPLTVTANGTLAASFINSNSGVVAAGISFGSAGSNNLSAGIAGVAQSGTSGYLTLQYVTGGSLTEGLRITTAGQIQAPAIHNNGSGASGTTPMLASGTYTPGLIHVTNISSSSVPGSWKWSRVGNVVRASGQVTFTPTATGGVQLDIELPIASNFAVAADATGGGVTQNSNRTASVVANTVNDRLSLQTQGTAGVGDTFNVYVMYEVL